MLHAESFACSLQRVIARGGDTDTNGCIAGAMLGALFGADAVPQEWVKTVKQAKERYASVSGYFSLADVDELVEKLARLS